MAGETDDVQDRGYGDSDHNKQTESSEIRETTILGFEITPYSVPNVRNSSKWDIVTTEDTF